MPSGTPLIKNEYEMARLSGRQLILSVNTMRDKIKDGGLDARQARNTLLQVVIFHVRDEILRRKLKAQLVMIFERLAPDRETAKLVFDHFFDVLRDCKADFFDTLGIEGKLGISTVDGENIYNPPVEELLDLIGYD